MFLLEKEKEKIIGFTIEFNKQKLSNMSSADEFWWKETSDILKREFY